MDNYFKELLERLTDISDNISYLTLEIDHLRDDIREYNDNRS